MKIWKCPVCGSSHAAFLCPYCGFDESKNPANYPSIFRLSDSHKKLFSCFLYDGKASAKRADDALERQDYDSARAWYHAAAWQGHIPSQCLLGDYYSSIGNDEKAALFWYKKAADSGNSKAQYELAEHIKSSDDTALLKECLDLYERSAKSGYAKAQHVMGELHHGKDAEFWYQKAADQGYAKSMFALACLYENSRPEEETTALYLRAAELGSADAQREVWTRYLSKETHPGFYNILEKTEESRWYDISFRHHEWMLQETFFRFLFDTPTSEHKKQCLSQLNEDFTPYWLKTDANVLEKLKKQIQNRQYDKLLHDLSSDPSITSQVLRSYYTCKGLGTEKNLYSDGSYFMILVNNTFRNSCDYAEFIEKYAVWGCRDLQFDLGFCYANGFGVPADPEKAVYWYKKAESWNPTAVWRELGILYKNNKDDVQALSFYQKAADAGDPESYFRLGQYFIKRIINENPCQMFQYFEKGAALGHAQAQAYLGICYDTGIGTEHNAQKAVYWYEKAADQWDSTGLTRLGFCLENGRGISKDPAKAVHYYQKAADQMDGYACYLLSKCYENGVGITPDPELAKRYLDRSVILGNAMSMLTNIPQKYYLGNLLETLYTVMERFYGYIPDENPISAIADTFFEEKNYDKAAYWYQRLISAGYISPTTYFKLGECCFLMGNSDNTQYNNALNWYKKADEHAAAHRQIGIIYKYGYGVPTDKKEAKKWLKSACRLGDLEAVKHLIF